MFTPVSASCEPNSWEIPISKGGLENVNLCSESKEESTLHGDTGKLDWKDFFYNKFRQTFLQAYQKSGINTINENKQKKNKKRTWNKW